MNPNRKNLILVSLNRRVTRINIIKLDESSPAMSNDIYETLVHELDIINKAVDRVSSIPTDYRDIFDFTEGVG
jgi:hypothetical protein